MVASSGDDGEAFWLGPWRRDAAALEHFEQVAHFDQLLLRACIRSLVVAAEFGHVHEGEL